VEAGEKRKKDLRLLRAERKGSSARKRRRKRGRIIYPRKVPGREEEEAGRYSFLSK